MAKKDAKEDLPAVDPFDVKVAKESQRAIGQGLREMFDSVVEEGVPEAFEALLDQLEQETGKPGGETAPDQHRHDETGKNSTGVE